MYILAGLNDLDIGISSIGEAFMAINGTQTNLTFCCDNSSAILTDGWNRHCFTFKSAGQIKVIALKTI